MGHEKRCLFCICRRSVIRLNRLSVVSHISKSVQRKMENSVNVLTNISSQDTEEMFFS